tara:strand:- start:7515 stop:8477 length:963 start_codon:yes stop_codon:yes gene_type:complete
MKHIKLFEDWTKDYSDAIKKAYAEYAIVSIISDYKYKQKGQKPVTWKRGTEMLASLGTGPRGGINIRSVKEGGFEVTPAEFKKHWTIVDKISKDEFWKLVKKLPSGFDDPVLPSGFRINEISTQVPAKMVGMDILGDDEEDEEMAGPMGTVGYLGIDESKPATADTYRKIKDFNLKALKGFARKVGLPGDVVDGIKDTESGIDEIMGHLYDDNWLIDIMKQGKVITLDEGKKLKGWDYTGTISYGSGKQGIYYQYPNNIKYYVEVTPEEYDDYLEGGSLKKKLEKKWADSGRAISQDEFRRKYPLKGLNKYLSQGGRMWD